MTTRGALGPRRTSRPAAIEEAIEGAGFVDFRAAGSVAVGEFHCSECGYGVVVHHALPVCPMCGGCSWEPVEWSPFSRVRGDRSLA